MNFVIGKDLRFTNRSPDTDQIVLQSFDCEVLAELSMQKVGPLQLPLPITIGLDLIYEDGARFTSVSGQIVRTVSLKVEPADR